MRHFLTAAIAAIALAGCGPQLPQGASAELASLLKFTEYPGATLVDESISQGSLGPFGMPGNHGSRLYETTATPEQIRTHYEGLASQHGWLIDDAAQEPFDTRYEGQVAHLAHERFSAYVSVSPTKQPLTGPYSYGYPKEPPSPSPSPGAEPTPAPTPHPGPWYVRVDAHANPY